jgi:hypothetical protein
MTPPLADILTVAGFCSALWTGYMIATRLSMLLLAAELDDGCTACYLLGRIPFGPPYWLLRQHLRRVAQVPDEGIREPAP